MVLALGGQHHDFWMTILDYEKASDFIIHDMTDCARGVMIEVGFSFGTQKQYFLVWNSEKQPVNNWEEMNIPSLLPTAHIEQVRLSEKENMRQVLTEKIVKRTLSDSRPFECGLEKFPAKKSGRKTAFVYSNEPRVFNFLDEALRKRNVDNIEEDESKEELRICKIQQVLNAADLVIIDLSDRDLNSFIVLGMAKALEKNILPITFNRYGKGAFPWAKDTVKYRLKNLSGDLDEAIATFLAYSTDN